MANQTELLNVSDEMKLENDRQNLCEELSSGELYSSSSDTTEELYFSSTTDTCGDGSITTTGKLDQDIYYVRVKLDVSNMQYISSEKPANMPVHGRGGKGSYAEIKAYVKEKYGLKVSSLYIAQVKDKVGIKERVSYNRGNGDNRVPLCPAEKEKAIVEAFAYFGMI